MNISIVAVAVSCVVLVQGCGLMRTVGEGLEEWGSKRDGSFLGDSAQIAGQVYQEASCLGTGEDDPECKNKKSEESK